MSECLCGIWKILACLLQDMEAAAQILAFFPDNNGNNLNTTSFLLIQIRVNTSFETIKGLLLFVYTHNNKTCFCKIKKTDRMLFVLWTGAPYKNEQKFSALATRLIDVKNICIENLKCLLSFEKNTLIMLSVLKVHFSRKAHLLWCRGGESALSTSFETFVFLMNK